MIIHDKWRREALESTSTAELENQLKNAKLDLANLTESEEEEFLDYFEDIVERLESELFERNILTNIPESLVIAGTDKGALIVRDIEWNRTKVLTIYGWISYKWLKVCKSMKETQSVVGV